MLGLPLHPFCRCLSALSLYSTFGISTIDFHLRFNNDCITVQSPPNNKTLIEVLMLKLYFKKLLILLCTFLMWLAITVTLCTIFGLANQPQIDYGAYSLCMIAGGVITAVLTGVVKARDSVAKLEYLTEIQLQRLPFGREVFGVLRSRYYIAEALAFLTWLVPLMVYVCTFPENAAKPIHTLILTSVFVTLVFTVVFALFDLIVTFTVRKFWMRGH